MLGAVKLLLRHVGLLLLPHLLLLLVHHVGIVAITLLPESQGKVEQWNITCNGLRHLQGPAEIPELAQSVFPGRIWKSEII